MTLHIALLRAVNVGKRTAGMTDLRAVLARLKLENPRSMLQSGNLLFECSGRSTADLESLLETETEKRLGLATDYFVRTIDEWNEVIARNPFRDEAERDPGHLLAIVTKVAPTAAQVKALRSTIVGREVVEAGGRVLYAFYPDGVGRSKLTNKLLAKHLASPCTGRNWNTVLRLARG